MVMMTVVVACSGVSGDVTSLRSAGSSDALSVTDSQLHNVTADSVAADNVTADSIVTADNITADNVTADSTVADSVTDSSTVHRHSMALATDADSDDVRHSRVCLLTSLAWPSLGRLLHLVTLEGGLKCPSVGTYVRPYVLPSTKSFSNFSEIWYADRGR